MDRKDASAEHAGEVERGERFEFGANWERFLQTLDEQRIRSAEGSLQDMLGLESLQGMRFLDAGSGSGLFSLAARRLGADVHSFDYDPCSVACTRELRRRYLPEDPRWSINQATVLDGDYLASLGNFDVVYSCGVLHHTGSMWQAMGNIATTPKMGGLLYIAIYNDQGWRSHYWSMMKRAFNRGSLQRYIVTVFHLPLYLGRVALRAARGRLREGRGMSLWHDYIDWLGGYPFETASAQQVTDFYLSRGYDLYKLRSVGRRSGCNEFVFRRSGVD